MTGEKIKVYDFRNNNPSPEFPEIKNNTDVLNTLLQDIRPINFMEIIYLDEIRELKKLLDRESDEDSKKEILLKIKQLKVTDKQRYVVVIEELLRLAEVRKWGICKNSAFTYIYNGAYWDELDREVLQKFLGDAAEKMSFPKYNARQYAVKDCLFRQFLSTGFQPMPENDRIMINLKNGTFEVDENGKGTLRPVNKEDFLKYQLPFEYNPKAKCPIFEKYLDVSLPDKESQLVLSEFVGYLFIHNLKLEKALILYGTGANGKSVFFDVISALLGTQNICSYSIDSLCEPNGYFRAKLANKLLNYSSEIGKNINSDLFKQLCSGEAVGCRLPYQEPFEIRHYAKMIFNANQLPQDVEQTVAFFRRFLIIPFTVTIPPEQQDVDLSKKIINNELSGVFNWVLDGLDRIVRQKKFSRCLAAEKELERYRRESDSVEMFILENNYQKSINDNKPLKDIYYEYRCYCNEVGNRACSLKTFSQRLKDKGFEVLKGAGARIVYIEHLCTNLPF